MLSAGGNGRAAWHAAIRMLSLGGGGKDITFATLLENVVLDYPNNPEIKALLS